MTEIEDMQVVCAPIDDCGGTFFLQVDIEILVVNALQRIQQVQQAESHHFVLKIFIQLFSTIFNKTMLQLKFFNITIFILYHLQHNCI